MNIVWFSWKDSKHPDAGGAEVVSDHIRTRLAADGHSVTLITAQYPGSTATETVSGVKILRAGGRYGVYWAAKKLYKKHNLQAGIVIDEMNTIPFMTPFYAKGTTNILLTYQLARSVWFYQMVFPLSLVGYCIEPLYLRLISKRYNVVLTESESTKTDLKQYGFLADDIHVFRVGIETKPLTKIDHMQPGNTVIFLGALRPMKRPVDAIKAFEYARDVNPKLQLVMAGNDHGNYADKVKNYAQGSRHSDAITIEGRVSAARKTELLRQASVIVTTSTKEGWGLIVTEANSQATPAITYDVDGLRDSVVDGKTGRIVASGDPESLGKAINELLSDTETYTRLRANAFEHSKQFTFESSYQDFVKILDIKPAK